MFQPLSSRLTPIVASAEAHWSSVSHFTEMASVTTPAILIMGMGRGARHSVRAGPGAPVSERRARSDAPYQPDKMRIAVTTLAFRAARGIPSRIDESVAFLDTKGLSTHLAG
jgi:hypothetical protein